MFVVIVELVTGFIQYLAIVVNIQDIDFPDSWKSPFYSLSVLNLQFNLLGDIIPALNDVRLYFTVISVIGPLIFVLLGLIFLNPKLIVLWYLVLLVGCVLFLAGAFARLISAVSALEISSTVANIFMIIGAAMVLVAIIAFLIRFVINRNRVEIQTQKQLLDEETKKCSIVDGVGRLLMAGVCIAFFFTGAFGLKTSNATIRSLILGISYTCLVVAGFALIWFVLGLFEKGRRFQWTLGRWAETSFLRALLLAMSLLYIPIGSGVFYVFNCNEFSCPKDWRLPDPQSHVWYNATTSYCVWCSKAPLATQNCPAQLWNQLCEPETLKRLEYDKSLACTAMHTMFWPAAGLIIVLFVIGAPLLFYFLIWKGSDLLLAEFPLLADLRRQEPDIAVVTLAPLSPPSSPDTPADPNAPPQPTSAVAALLEETSSPEERWDQTLAASNNVAKFLYQPFQPNYRYVRLLQLIEKGIIVTATMYVYRSPDYSPGLPAIVVCLGTHIVASVLFASYRPFIKKFETNIAVLMEVALSVASVMGLLLLRGVSVPSPVMWVIIVLNGLLPLVALVISVILEYSRGKEDKEKKEKRKAALVEEAVASQNRADEEALAATLADGGELDDPDEQSPPGSPTSPTGDRVVPVGKRMSPRSPNHDEDDSLRMTVSAVNYRKRTRRADAKRRIEQALAAEQARLEERQGDVDMRIDQLVKSWLNGFFMVGGVLGFVALGLCILGLLVQPPVDLPTHGDQPTEFARYVSWSNFTQHCCCMPHYNPPGNEFAAVEKWVCDNQRIKERIRVVNRSGVLLSGLSIRAMCSVTFQPGCVEYPNYQLDDTTSDPMTKYGVRCAVASGIQPWQFELS